MIRVLVIAVSALCLGATSAQQSEHRGAFETVRTQGALDVRAALQRDPRTLPHASEGRWARFDGSLAKDEPLPDGMAQAARALSRRDLPAAMQALFRVLDATPEYPPALHELGVLYFRLQRYSDAAEALERYLRVAPSRVGDTRALGHCYYSLGQYERAKSHYVLVLNAAPDDVEALRGLALSEMRLGNADVAKVGLKKVLELAPKHADAALWLAQILFDQGASEEALALATRAQDLDPYQSRAWFLLGQILFDLGRDEEARRAEVRYQELNAAAQEIRSVETRLLLDAGNLQLLLRLVELHRDTGNVAKTREALADVLYERPRDVDLRIYALDVLDQMGDVEGARLAATTLQDVGADDARAWQRLEAFYAKTKDRTQQVRAGERYRRLKDG